MSIYDQDTNVFNSQTVQCNNDMCYLFQYQMIVRNTVTQESKIKKFLKLLCNDYPLKCGKQSISGFMDNDRVIVVRSQSFQYYNMPKNFIDGNMSSLNEQNFKARVNLSDIYQISFLPQSSNEKKTMTLSIPLNKINAKNISIYKQKSSIATSKDAKQNYIVCWKFVFKYDIKKQLFNKLDDEEKRKKQSQNNIIKYDASSVLQDSILNISKQKIQDQIPMNPSVDLHHNIEKLRLIKQEIQFQQKIQKQEEQRQKLIKISMNLRKNDKEESGQQAQQEQIYPIKQSWRDFWKVYEKCSKNIGSPLSKQVVQKQIAVLSQIYKLQTQVKQIAVNYIQFKMVGWSPQKITYDGFEFYKGIWIKLGGKQLNQQFLSNSILSDLMYITKNYKKMKFRVPPMFFINYKSIKALCMIDQPFSSIKAVQKQIYNLKSHKSQMDVQLMGKIKQALQMFERIINIKNQNYINANIDVSAPLGCDVKVYEYDNKFEDNSTYYLQNFYYVTGVKGLFPIDYEYQEHKSNPQYCLRPQIIAQYRDYMESAYREDNQLLTQAFKHSKIQLEIKGKQDPKVAEVSKLFIPLKIGKLMHEFNQINLILVDSYSLKAYMSQMGINARYLGQMYYKTEIPYIQEFLQVQMLSRVMKNIYNDSVRELITNESFFKREVYLKKHKDVLLQNMKIHHDLMSQNAIDFLNLIFGIGNESEAFWSIVLSRCQAHYGIKLNYPTKVKPGCLLHAVLWHCAFIVNFELDIKLFETEKPFSIKNWNQFRIECKSFQYPSFQVNKIIKKISIVDNANQDNQLNKYIFSFMKLELMRNHASAGLGLKTQTILSRINNMKSGLQKSVRECSYHPSELPFYFSNKTQQNFKKALDIINFSLASNHPLFISLYDTYSSQFQSELLKKSTLLAAIKGLGQFHPRTTQLYSKYYRLGFKKFEIKAKRSQQTEAALTISQQLFGKKKYESCLNFCFSRIQKRKNQKSTSGGNDLVMYIQILKHGLMSAAKTRFYQKGSIIAQQFSEMINTYKIRKFEDNEILLYHALIFCLSLASQKFYLYKMVLLVVRIQKQFQSTVRVDADGFVLPVNSQQKNKILLGIMNEYYLQQTHLKWIQHIFFVLKKGYLYFNHLDDLFNKYKYHIKNYGMIQFENSLGYLDVLVRYFGQKIFYDYLYQV